MVVSMSDVVGCFCVLFLVFSLVCKITLTIITTTTITLTPTVAVVLTLTPTVAVVLTLTLILIPIQTYNPKKENEMMEWPEQRMREGGGTEGGEGV